jgi:tungstate transport system ATP-binding protein
MANLITLQNVRYTVAGRALVQDISLRVRAGERLLILGANGAGKSTLLRLAHGLIAPSAGEMHIQNDAQQAMLFQRPALLKRSVRGNVEFALSAHGIADPNRVDDALTACGLQSMSARHARALSGGEQQRLALACAWALAPQVLFADEPTASLDVQAVRDVERLLLALHAKGCAVVMTTHSLAQAKRLAQRIVFLHKGRVTDDLPVAQFFEGARSGEANAFFEGELF